MKPAPFKHQSEDTAALLAKPAYALFVEPGGGKSRTVIDAAAELYRRGVIDAMIVVCPAPARSVWIDSNPVIGEYAKWAADDVPYTLNEYHAKTNLETVGMAGRLNVLVTNPEFVRRSERLKPLQIWAKKRKTFLVADEGWQFKTPNAAQTKALQRLRACCQRAVILNGTPGQIHEQYAQFRVIDPQILDSYNFSAFKARYCVQGGYMGRQIIGYQNTEEFHAKTAPYCVVRRVRDCVDLPPEPVRTQIEARLTPATWKIYTEMRDELITWLSENEHVVALQAGVKVMRLAQLTNGFVGGVSTVEEATEELLGLFTPETEGAGNPVAPDRKAPPSPLREIGREKLDATVAWLRDYWTDPKGLLFTKFRADVERLAAAIAKAFPKHEVVKIYGSQPPADRERAKILLAPGGDPTPAFGVINAQSGGAGLNLAASALALFVGHDYSSRIRRQAEGRVDRPGQTQRVRLVDVIATGPLGQKTIDHDIIAAVRRRENLEQWGAAEWRKALAS